MLAAQRGYDIIGSLLLGSLTGLGGGVIRDLIIGVPPAAFAQPIHLAAPVAAALLVFFLASRVERHSRTLLIFDAGGLALFCTTGTVTALGEGMNPVAALLLGVTTGVGGGLMRDVVANRDPQLFSSDDLYAVPAPRRTLRLSASDRRECACAPPRTSCSTTNRSVRTRNRSIAICMSIPSFRTRKSAPPMACRSG
ncbi:trimeric intracellular cation channel family protein [Microbacterium sp. CH12i]|uniref:trimeric intracellular cation channel family protein n=1 Tax=Microbacterium sp. CH12i TaxID=1479651 RepID=UPI003FA55038